MSVELLSPAGNFQTALSAFEAGADAVYCGLPEFSARAFADNFSIDDLRNLLRYSRKHGKKVYVTFNTLIDEDDVESAIDQLARLDEIRPDALIVQDIGIARLCRKYFPDLELHASTQLVAHNLEGVLAMKELGFKRVVLARELSIPEIASISKRCGIELECFIHGALCYSISGLCLFSAMEKGRSGNRGRCAYCCRLPYDDESGRKTLAFSMKDLRLGSDVSELVDAGVVSLKIEGRMKNEIYVSSVTRYYRNILDSHSGDKHCIKPISVADLETVFSRRTTELYLHGSPKESVIDPDSLGHLGTEIGTVKRLTKDRDGLTWLRFHTMRALEKHDGLQFVNPDGGKPLGMGISEMRQAISRRPVFEVGAGTDVEILVPHDQDNELVKSIRSGMKVYCSASQAVRRMFPVPSFRPSDYEGGIKVDLRVRLAVSGIVCEVLGVSSGISQDVVASIVASVDCDLQTAKNPDKTFDAVRKAFSKFGDTDYSLGRLEVDDPDLLFAPMSVLNDLRRDIVERLDEQRDRTRHERMEAALDDDSACDCLDAKAMDTVKIRSGQRVPNGNWDEVVITIDPETAGVACDDWDVGYRLSVPVYTKEPDFNRLRVVVKGLVRKGFLKWEASDLATLRMLKLLGIEDITADWTLYAFNLSALRQLSEMGVRGFVSSPENTRENLQFLAECGYRVEFLKQQSTPLFISLTQPASFPNQLSCQKIGNLWVTTKPVPRTFDIPEGVSTRLDLSWDPQ